MQFHVTELREFTEYTFYVSAFNANGEGALSEEITCMTLSDIPADPPQNISLEASSSTSIIGEKKTLLTISGFVLDEKPQRKSKYSFEVL